MAEEVRAVEQNAENNDRKLRKRICGTAFCCGSQLRKVV